MFQFPEFPAHTYGFSIRSVILHHGGFPIRKSADQYLFTAPRSLSQLVTSFFGSQCQGIHLMLFFAWTVFRLFSSLLELRLQLIVWVAFSLCRSKAFLFSTTLRWQNCSFPTLLGKTFKKSNLLKIFAQLSVRLLFFLFIQFSMNIPQKAFTWKAFLCFGGLKWTRTTDLALIRRAL